ncbi:MAG: hypothetical protein NTW72_07685, partial [Gemmatimonadetes bacterium]|nr:hypothetical protein [Gemmatimonadota bacterium]
MRDGDLVLGFEARPPEPAAQFHLRVTDFPQPAQGRWIGLDAGSACGFAGCFGPDQGHEQEGGQRRDHA